MISALNSHDIRPPFYDPMSPLDPPSERQRIIPKEYAKDTIKQSEDAWAFLAPEFAIAAPLNQNGIFNSSSSRPKLEAPSFDSKKLKGVDAEVEQLVTKVEQSDEAATQKKDAPLDQNLAEIALLQSYIACMKTQRIQNETNAELTFDTVQKNQDANALIKKDYFNTLDEIIKQNEKSGILSWVNWILYGALAVVGLASLALTLTASVVTGGAALPLGLTVTMALVNGVLSIASGTTTIFRGVLDYNNKQARGTLEEKQFERTLNTQRIKTGMEEMQQSMDVISEVWKELMKVVNNWREASLERGA